MFMVHGHGPIHDHLVHFSKAINANVYHHSPLNGI